jgi:hypothetical protein
MELIAAQVCVQLLTQQWSGFDGYQAEPFMRTL